MPEGPDGDAGHVAVVGAGITGLAAAWFLRSRAEVPPRVTLVEAGPRAGGKLATSDDLVAPATGRAYIWTRGALRPLPDEQVLGVPTALRPLFRSGAVPPAAVARAALDRVLPRRRLLTDASVADVIGRRLGPAVVDRLVDPLLGGIHAERTDRLSVRAVAPPLADAAGRGHGSLMRALAATRTAALSASAGPVFLGISGGMARLTDGLARGLADDDGAEVVVDTPVVGIHRTDDGRLRVACDPGVLLVDAVVLTVPAYAAVPIVHGACPDAAAELDTVEYASVAIAALAYEPDAVSRSLDGSGFLVPRVDGRLLTACSWATSKWPALGEAGLVVVRASVGRLGDERAAVLDDDELVARIGDELGDAVGIRTPPVATRVTRWPRALPQQDVGHQARVERIERALARDLPGVVVAGAAYRGLGVAACVRQARDAADLVSARRPLA